MPDSTAIDALLACPRCDNALVRQDNLYSCNACNVEFPELDGIPFLFAEPQATFGEWRARLHSALTRIEHDVAGLKQDLEKSGLHDLTRQRLQLLLDANEDQGRRLSELLGPLDLAGMQASHESYLALKTRLPADQGLNTYYANIHRDWTWGDEENAASAKLVGSLLEEQPEAMLVLGAGACRLAYDLHMQHSPGLTVALDFNPMLLLLARQIMHGKPVELYEFPIAPKKTADHAILRTLATEKSVGDGFYFVLADALRPPFGKGSFDTVLTPWISDILPDDFRMLARRINRLLKPGGQWINFGSLTFTGREQASRYSLEECLALVTENGFATPEYREDTIPYMCSPASRHGRQETVLTFSTKKQQDAESPPRYQSLPDWIVRKDLPVPVTESFKIQAMTTRIHAFVMGMIDGRRSIGDMAKLMEEQRLMTRQEAEPTIRSFLIKMYDASDSDLKF